MDLTLDEIVTYWEHRHPGQRIGTRDKVAVKCVLHDDSDPSCTLFLSGNGAFHCHGCGAKGNLFQFEARFSGCDLQQAELNVAAITGAKPTPRREREVNLGPPTDIYDYRDESGKVLYQKRRYEPELEKKTFRTFHQTERGWKAGIDPKDGPKNRRVLFNLPDVVKANIVILVEGEKCARAVMVADLFASRGLSIAVTTTYDGAWKPGQNAKWLDCYSPYFTGKQVFILPDNDEPGQLYAAYAAQSIAPFAYNVRVVDLPGLGEKGDVSDFLMSHTALELEAAIQSSRTWTPPTQVPALQTASPLWQAEDMNTFLAATESDIEWIVPQVLAPGRLTEIFAPRGLGKSLLAIYWGVQAARSGLRVLILDRDNPRKTLQSRLRSFGAENLEGIRVISREKCPPLTDAIKWAKFPYSEYDLVIVDSLNAMAEGVGEQDSAAPARAMASLLDICHREGGPAVLLIGNTIKTGAHSRGSGVVEDRADVVYEVRDGTDFRPTGRKPWIEELPLQGAGDWTIRNSKRKRRSRFRLALAATKFRDGEEPAPQMLEICTEEEPYTITDVTALIDPAGEEGRSSAEQERAARIAGGLSALLAEIDSRCANGQLPMLKTDAEAFLMSRKFTRKDARTITESNAIEAIPGSGKGHPKGLHRRREGLAAEMPALADPCKDRYSERADFCRPQLTPLAEIQSAESRSNQGQMQPSISGARSRLSKKGPVGKGEKGASADQLFFDLEV